MSVENVADARALSESQAPVQVSIPAQADSTSKVNNPLSQTELLELADRAVNTVKVPPRYRDDCRQEAIHAVLEYWQRHPGKSEGELFVRAKFAIVEWLGAESEHKNNCRRLSDKHQRIPDDSPKHQVFKVEVS